MNKTFYTFLRFFLSFKNEYIWKIKTLIPMVTHIYLMRKGHYIFICNFSVDCVVLDFFLVIDEPSVHDCV